MIKLIYLLWPQQPMEPAARRAKLLDECAPKLLESGARYLSMNIDDEFATVPSPTPTTERNNPFAAEVSIWVEDMNVRDSLESILRDAGFDIAGYRVREHVYTDYGGNPHGARRDWPDGERSPYVVSVTPLERRKRIPKDKWMKHWFNRQGPMSEKMQPRARYVRNVVDEVLTPGAIPYEGIVEESWPSAAHMTNPFVFYGAQNRLELIKNMAIMGQSVAAFLPIWRIVSVTTSEYWVRSRHG
ncbi:MAG: hypothetical protein JSV06_05195 [Myxococcales bacterium]|nr:MAG: hypothetical protein JSV06_05195 [Myxococcales bacterium]